MPDTDAVMIKAVRPFEGQEGWKDESSPAFSGTQERLEALKAKGLARLALPHELPAVDGAAAVAEAERETPADASGSHETPVEIGAATVVAEGGDDNGAPAVDGDGETAAEAGEKMRQEPQNKAARRSRNKTTGASE